MSKILIFVVFLVAFANCNSFFSLNSDGKVQVDFYYESLCPYCQQFIQKSLKTAANTKVLLLIFRISGKFVISGSILMVMQKELKVDLNGITHVNME